MAAIALEDDWEVLATPTASAAAAASAAAPAASSSAAATTAASAKAAAAAAAELLAAKKEAAALRAELALTRTQLLTAEQHTFSAEQEATRLSAINTQQRHTITQLANQLALVTAASAAGPAEGPANALASSTLALSDDEPADSTASLSPVLGADASRATTLRAMRRAAKSNKHQFKAHGNKHNAKTNSKMAVQQPKQRFAAPTVGRSAS